MQSNRIVPRENHTGISTISITNLSATDRNDDDDDLPTYNQIIDSSRSQSSHLPPNYFDISIVPKGSILYYNDIIPSPEPSKAHIKRETDGILSLDSLIDKNPDQLWLYFMTYLNERPSLFVHIFVQHTAPPAEQYYPNSYTIKRYNYRVRPNTDFNYSIDLTPYISKHFSNLAVVREKKSINEIITIRHVLEEYTRSNKYFKEILCQKQLIGWNFHELRKKLRKLIFSTGYKGQISITFSIENHQIIARSSSKFNRFANSIWTRLLCFISCFCLFFAPIYFCLRSISSVRHQVVADYHMISSIDTFIRTNTDIIVRPIFTRSKGRFIAKL